MFRITLNYLEKHFLIKEQSYFIPDKEIHAHTHKHTHIHSLTCQCIKLKVFGGYNIYNIFSCYDIIRTETRMQHAI